MSLKILNNTMRLIQINETKDKLTLVKLPFNTGDLEPVMEKDTVEFHYNVLSRGYVDRYNNSEGDLEFNKAGALLHNLWWPQLKKPKISNSPQGTSKDFIEKHFNSFEDFKDEFNDIAAKIQGSGWCYLAKDGSIKTIANHKWRNDIIILIDCWEHSYYLDYPADKKKYLRNIWKIINWDIINDRLE